MTWSETKARRIVAERSGGVCELDGFRPAESLSHRIAVARGGTWAPSGLVHTCGDGVRGCHGWLEANPTYAGEGRWQIRRLHRANPLDIPVYLRPRDSEWGWHLLDDAGGRWLVDPDDYGLPLMPAHFPPSAARPLHTTPWVDPR